MPGWTERLGWAVGGSLLGAAIGILLGHFLDVLDPAGYIPGAITLGFLAGVVGLVGGAIIGGSNA